jgi:hypothetical protein
LEDPPPEAFILACIVYAYCLMSIREKLKQDRYQDRGIRAGVCCGVAATIYTRDVRNLKGYVAWSAALALGISALCHWIVKIASGKCNKPTAFEQVNGKGEIG